MPTLTSKYTPAGELGSEARGALRCIVALAEELGRERWGERRPPLDPRQAPAELASDAVLCALLAACDAIAGIGTFGRDATLSDDTLTRVVPVLQTVEHLVSRELCTLEDDLGVEATHAAGWTTLMEVLVGVRYVTQVGLMLWPATPARMGVAA